MVQRDGNNYYNNYKNNTAVGVLYNIQREQTWQNVNIVLNLGEGHMGV